VLLNALGFTGADIGQYFVQQPQQDGLVFRYGHGQLKAIRGFAADVQAIKFELAQAPYTGSQITHHRIYLVCGQGLQRRADVGQGDDVEVGVLGAQQLVRGVVLDHANPQAVEFLDVFRRRAALVGEDDNGEVQVGPGKRQALLALGRRHDAG